MNLNSSIMGLPTEDHLHDDVPFDEDDGLHQNMQSYPQSDMSSLEGQASSILSHHSSSSDLNSARGGSYNTAKYPPQLLRRLPRALYQPQGQQLAPMVPPPQQSSNQEIMGQQDDSLHSPLAQEQMHPPTNQDHHNMPHDFNSSNQPQQQQQSHPMHGMSVPGLQSKLALVPHIQPPLLYQLAPQMPQHPVQVQGQPHLQLMNLGSHIPQQSLNKCLVTLNSPSTFHNRFPIKILSSLVNSSILIFFLAMFHCHRLTSCLRWVPILISSTCLRCSLLMNKGTKA